ncbi:hypothetical protein ACU4GD_14495 [Cupriavidus basilensis]
MRSRKETAHEGDIAVTGLALDLVAGERVHQHFLHQRLVAHDEVQTDEIHEPGADVVQLRETEEDGRQFG